MLRSVLGASLAAAVLTAGALSPASAGTDVAALPVHSDWGSVTGTSGSLLKGCQSYNYRYTITPPKGIWAAEFFVTDPSGAAVSNGASLDGYDPKTGTQVFTLCRKATRPGTFTIRTKVSVDDGFGDITEGQLPPATFTLTKQAREVWAEQPL